MWHSLWPGRPAADVPIGHVTNGVHLPTWMAPRLRRLLAERLGPDFEERCDEAALWDALEALPDEALWSARNELRHELVSYVRDKSILDRLARGTSDRHYVEAAAQGFDDGVLTVGFARRIAAYKRLHLLTRDPERALRLIDGPHSLQIVIAGKAHPMDQEAKRLVQQIFPLRERGPVGSRVAFLEDYDLRMAARLVREQVLRANSSIYQAAQTQPQYAGMGTTLVVALFYDNRVLVAHLGDSRLYLLRENELRQVTRDHSLLQEQIDSGLLTAEQAKNAQHKNLVTKALGIDPSVEPEIHEYPTQPGDLYLLCSDGLCDMVEDEQIRSALLALGGNLKLAAQQLVQMANDNGGRDNVSVILVRVLRDYPGARGVMAKVFAWLK